LNPWVPQPGAFPTVMSVRPSMPMEYNIGLRNPRGGRPEEIRASFNNAKIAAAAGVDADVPETRSASPPANTRYLEPCAEISGYAWSSQRDEGIHTSNGTYASRSNGNARGFLKAITM